MIHRPKNWPVVILAFLALALPLSVLHAQGLQVTPVVLDMQPGQTNATLLLANNAPEAATVQLRPFQWVQTATGDELRPTNLLGVSPPITQIAAGQTQVFRILLRRPAAIVEGSYRLMIDQLPSASSNPGNIRLLLRFSIPLFSSASTETKPDIGWRIERDAQGASLVATNRGRVHVHLLDPLRMTVGPATVDVDQLQNPYILPGTERTWHIRDATRLRAGGVAQLKVGSNAGPIEAQVDVAGP